ncbi:helix-turn-helix transcriptional regulator [Deinococcota bacterium DY0809b]
MPLYAGRNHLGLWHDLLADTVPERVHLVVDQPVGFALWGLDPLPRPALVLTFNRHPLYLLDLFERRPAGVLLAPDALDALSEALKLVAWGHRVGTPPTLPFDAPTPRERQVLRLLAQGHCADAIAQALGVKRDTVYTYLQNLREKLGAESQHELALNYLDALAQPNTPKG